MRDHFGGYYPPSEPELAELWGEGLVVLDANALLNLYRYTPSTREDFVATLREFSDRVWLPHQAGLEFHRRRLDVIEQQARAYDALVKGLAQARAAVTAEANRFRRHPLLSVAELLANYDRAVAPIEADLQKAREGHRGVAPAGPHDDAILAEVTELFRGRVGECFGDDEMRRIYAEGVTRYEQQVPPGYKDAAKDEPERYGDLVIWKELLRKGSELHQSLLFVTDDRKEDWWWEASGKTVGPRVELIHEYAAATGKRVHFYVPDQFLRFAKDRSVSRVSDASIGEVEAVSLQESLNRTLAFSTLGTDRLVEERDRIANRIRRAHRDPFLGDREALHESRERTSLQALVEELDASIARLVSEALEYEQYVVHLDHAVLADQREGRDTKGLMVERVALHNRQRSLARELEVLRSERFQTQLRLDQMRHSETPEASLDRLRAQLRDLDNELSMRGHVDTARESQFKRDDLN